jgi:transcriptional regulator with XRE-family HTH domain
MTLTEIRKKKNVRSVDVALRLGISQGYYSNLERGKRPFSEKLLKRTARVLGVTTNALRSAADASLSDSYKLKSWVSNIRINGLPFARAFKYHVQVNALEQRIRNDAGLRMEIKEFIEANIGYAVMAELSENKSLLIQVRDRIMKDN